MPAQAGQLKNLTTPLTAPISAKANQTLDKVAEQANSVAGKLQRVVGPGMDKINRTLTPVKEMVSGGGQAAWKGRCRGPGRGREGGFAGTSEVSWDAPLWVRCTRACQTPAHSQCEKP